MEKSQYLTKVGHLLKKKLIVLPHLIETAKSLFFKSTLLYCFEIEFLHSGSGVGQKRGYETYKSKIFTKTDCMEEKKRLQKTKRKMNTLHFLRSYVNIHLHSFFSNVEVYIKVQQTYKSDRLDVHKYHASKCFRQAVCGDKEVFQFNVFNYEKFFVENIDAILTEPSQGSWKRLKYPITLCCIETRRWCQITSDMLYPKTKVRIQLIRARCYF